MKTYREIASALGISSRAVMMAEATALLKVARHIGAEDPPLSPALRERALQMLRAQRAREGRAREASAS